MLLLQKNEAHRIRNIGLLMGKVKDEGKQNIALIAENLAIEELSNTDYEVEKCDNGAKEDYLFELLNLQYRRELEIARHGLFLKFFRNS